MDTIFLKIEKLNWKAFFIGILIGIIAMTFVKTGSINYLLNNFNSKNPTKQNNTLDQVIKRLKTQKNAFVLKTQNKNIVSNAYADSFSIPAFSYVVVDFDTGEILEEKNASKIVSIASLTKIMTAIVTLDLSYPTDIFKISEYASKIPPTKIGVVEGELMSVEELLKATLLTSANDAAQVIEEGIERKYKADIFEKAMNEKARFLGLTNSSFSNPQGFDSSKNYSTASDVAILSHYALTHYPLIAEIVKKEYEYLPSNKNHKQFDLYNWNGLINVYPNVYGVKIGNTDAAGRTTVVVSERDGKKVLVVLLGAPGILERDLWAGELLDRGFEKLGLPKIELTPDMLVQKYSTWRYWN